MSEITRTKRSGAYHHGDLKRALVDAALEIIGTEGIDALTLRNVGALVGVSRTALYRHFDNKASLLARIASEGYRLLHDTMARAVANSASDRGDALQVMAAAYLHFALANPSHYQTMFGGFLRDWRGYPDLVEHADAARSQFADAVLTQQRQGRIGPGNPVELGGIIWSLIHGIATLGAATHLPGTLMGVEELAVVGCSFLEQGMRPLSP